MGVAATSSEEKTFHSMASRRVPGAKEAIWLLKNAEKVASLCNDVVGDICGVISGATGATISVQLISQLGTNGVLTPLVVTGLTASLAMWRQSHGQNIGSEPRDQSGLFCCPCAALFQKITGQGGMNMDAYPLLSHITSPHDVGKLTDEQLVSLCAEIRLFLIANLSNTGGHLASNLGIVEIATAMR